MRTPRKRKLKQNKTYKICIVYKGLVEKCEYRFATSKTHAQNIGKLILKDKYGNNTSHYITVEEV